MSAAAKKTEAEKPKNTVFERARLIGSRALQISQGAPILIDMSEEELEAIHYNPVEIAKREYQEGVLPLEAVRPAPER